MQRDVIMGYEVISSVCVMLCVIASEPEPPYCRGVLLRLETVETEVRLDRQ